MSPRTASVSPLKRSASRPKSSATPRPRTKRPPGPDPLALIPPDENEVVLDLGQHRLKLTNLGKVFWPDLDLTKGDLLRYYVEVSPWLLPHVAQRPMVMKRYPNGIDGKFFFMKRAPSPRPEWIPLCHIEHASGNTIGFPVINDLAGLLWVVNLGCIDLNPWYARCDDVERPDFLHFDLDPTAGADFATVREVALLVRAALDALKIPSYAKTTGSRGIHIYCPIQRGPLQKEVWTVAKLFALGMEQVRPDLVTSEYRVAKRPRGHVLVDYNQNAWGRTLSSVYSPRPKPAAAVSMPVEWEEIEAGVEIEDFTLLNAPERLRQRGDLWAPLLATRGRYDLRQLLGQ
jgi:bifunctional non-homologous end joining protein LigD